MYDSQERFVVYLHEELIAQLEDGDFAQEAFRRRVTLLLQQFLATGQSNSYKAIQGLAKGWLRSPVQGYHYYLWWKTGSAMAFTGRGGRREDIYLRLLRHHDQTSEELSEGEQEAYQAVAPERLRTVVCFGERDGMMESPYSSEQYEVAHSRAMLRLLKGLPGTGKTTSLWLSTLASAENDGAKHVLYLTLSERLVERAEAFFASLETPTKVSCLPLVAFWARLAGEEESALFSAHEEELGRLFSTFAERRYTPLQRWEGAWELLFAEMYGQVFGRYCSPRILGGDGSSERSQRAVAWDFEKDAYLSCRQSVLGRDGQSVVQVLQFLQRTQEEAMRRSERRGEVLAQDEEKQAILLKLFRPLFLALWALGHLERGGEIPEALRSVDWIVVDEIQDLTPLEFRVLSLFWERLQDAHRSRETMLDAAGALISVGAVGTMGTMGAVGAMGAVSGAFEKKESVVSVPASRVVCLLAGDEGQTARPTFFDWGDVSDIFFRDGGKTETFDLRDNLRSPPLIAEILGASRALYSDWLPKPYRPSGLSHVPSKEEVTERPSVFLVKAGQKRVKDAFAKLLLFFRYLPDSVVLYPSVTYPSAQDLYDKEEGAYAREGAEIFLLSSEVKGLDFQWVGVVDMVLERVSEEEPLRLLRLRQSIDLLRIAISRSRERLVIFAAHEDRGVLVCLLRSMGLNTSDYWEGEIDDFCTEYGGYSFQEQDDQILSARLMAEKLAEATPEKALSHVQIAERLLLEQKQPNDFLLQHIVSLRMEIAYRLAILPLQGGLLQQGSSHGYYQIALAETAEALGEWAERTHTCEAMRADWLLRSLEMERDKPRFVETLARLLICLEQKLLRRLLPIFLQHSQQLLLQVSARAALFLPNQRKELLQIFSGFRSVFSRNKPVSVPLIEEARQDFLVVHAVECVKKDMVMDALRALDGEESAQRRFLVALFALPDISGLLELFFSKLTSNDQRLYTRHLRKALDAKEFGRREEVVWLRGALEVWEAQKPKRMAWPNFEGLWVAYKQSVQAARREAQALEKQKKDGGYYWEDIARRWEEVARGARVREAFDRDDFTRSLAEQKKLLCDEVKKLFDKILLEKSKEKRDEHRDQAKEKIYRVLRFEDEAFEQAAKGRRKLLRESVRALSLRNVTEILRQFFLLEWRLRTVKVWRVQEVRSLLLESLQRLTLRRRSEGAIEGEVTVVYRSTGEERSADVSRWPAAVPVWPVGLAKVLRRLLVVWPSELALLAESVERLLEEAVSLRRDRFDPRRCYPQYGRIKADLSLGSGQGDAFLFAPLLWFFRTISEGGMETFFHRFYEIALRYRAKLEELRHAPREKREEEERSDPLGEAQQVLRQDLGVLLEEVGTKVRIAEIAEGWELRESAWLSYVAARVWQEAEGESNEAEQGGRSWSSGQNYRQTALDRFEARWPEAYREVRRLFLALPFGEDERIWTWKEAFEALEEESQALQGTWAQHHQGLEALRRMRKMHKRLAAGEQGNRHAKDGEYFEVLAGVFSLDEVGETLARWGGWTSLVSHRVVVERKQEEEGAVEAVMDAESGLSSDA